jgi:hypothetical protein
MPLGQKNSAIIGLKNTPNEYILPPVTAISKKLIARITQP